MTRKHFNELAEQLRAVRPLEPEQLSVWRECCKAVATACKASNSGFSPERFIAACERD